MTNNINPINVNSKGVQYPKLKNEEKKQGLVKGSEQHQEVEKKEVAAKDVLGFMAAQSVDVQPKVKKVIDVSKYVTPEQAARIAGFVGSFEKEVEKGLKEFDKEFPGNKVSEDTKVNIAVDAFNRNNL